MMIVCGWFFVYFAFTAAAKAQDKTTIIKLQNAVKESSQNLKSIAKNEPQPTPTTLYTKSALPSSIATPNAIRKRFTFNTNGILKLNQKKKKKTFTNKTRSQKKSPTVRRFYVPMIENMKTNVSKIITFNKSTIQPKKISPQHKKAVRTRKPLKKIIKKKSARSNKRIAKYKKGKARLRKRTTKYKSAVRDRNRIRNEEHKDKILKFTLPRPRRKYKPHKPTLKRKILLSRGGKKLIRRILKTVGSSMNENTMTTMSLVYIRTSGQLKTKNTY